jgi:hypothetical protein
LPYAGTAYSLTGDVGQGDEPFAEPPSTLGIRFTEAFVPAQVSSLQVNFMSDCGWHQAVLSFGVIGSGLVSFGAAIWPVQAILQEGNFLVFQPTGTSLTPNIPVDDFGGTPITQDDLMSGRYFVRVEFLAGGFVTLLYSSATGLPVWMANRGALIAYNGIPKVLAARYVGATGGASLTFTGGHMTAMYAGTQTHDSQNNLIEPYPFRVLTGGDPSFTYPNGVVVQYANETGEGANLSETYTRLPNGAIQIDTSVLNSL